MNRTIDMSQNIPLHLMEFEDMQKIISVENVELQKIEDEHMQIIDNRYILSTDENGIRRFESMLGLAPYADDTLEERQFRALSRWNSTIPYNFRYLIEKLDMLCGTEGYKIEYDFGNYTLSLRVDVRNKKNLNSVKELVGAVIPCNMLWTVAIIYKTWNDVRMMKWNEVTSKTWNQLREGDY